MSHKMLRHLVTTLLLWVGVMHATPLLAQEARIGQEAYATLSEAIAAAQTGQTVTLLSAVSTASTIEINKSITLDLGQHTITGTGSNPLLNVNAAATIMNGRLAVASSTSPSLESHADVKVQSVGFGGPANLYSGEFHTQDCQLVNLNMLGQVTLRLTRTTVNVSESIQISNGSSLALIGSEVNGQIVVGSGGTLKTSKSDDGVAPKISSTAVVVQGNNDAQILLEDSEIEGSTKEAILLSGHAKAQLTRCTVTNKGSGYSTVEATEYASLDFDKCTISNTGTTSSALLISGYATFQTKGTAFKTQSSIGAAVSITGSKMPVLDGVIARAPNGVGISCTQDVELTNCDVIAKECLKLKGGALKQGNTMVGTSLVANATGTLNVQGGTYSASTALFQTSGTAAEINLNAGHFKGNLCSSSQCALRVTGGIYSINPSSYLIYAICTVRSIADTYSDYADGYRYYVRNSLAVTNLTKDEEYASLFACFNCMDTGDKLRLNSDLFLSDEVLNVQTWNHSIDLNGCTINCYNSSLVFLTNTEISGGTISGSGAYDNAYGKCLLILCYGNHTLNELTINAQSGTKALCLSNGEQPNQLSRCYLSGGMYAEFCKVIATDCEFWNDQTAVFIQGAYENNASYEGTGCTYVGTSQSNTQSVICLDFGDITDTNGTIISTGVYNNGIKAEGDVSLSNLTSTSNYDVASILCSGKADFYDCTIINECTGALAIQAGGQARIYGGTYKSASTVIAPPSSDPYMTYLDLTIYDGQFSCPASLIRQSTNCHATFVNGFFDTKRLKLKFMNTEVGQLIIKGGYFKANPNDYLDDGLFTVKPTGVYKDYNYWVVNNDVDGDGKISIEDIAWTVDLSHKHSFDFELKPFDRRRSRSSAAADTNGDGEVDGDDVARLSRRLLNLTDESLYLNGHEYVDLGITNAQGETIVWAKTNIGANFENETGLYFAWGEATGYSVGASPAHYFNLSSYEHGPGIEREDELTKYNASDGITTLEPADDAAWAQWGGLWRMPTDEEINSLMSQCDLEIVKPIANNGFGGVGGLKISNSSDPEKYIFLPVSGIAQSTNSFDWADSLGEYWSSLVATNKNRAFVMLFDIEDEENIGGLSAQKRHLGLPIRPVATIKK